MAPKSIIPLLCSLLIASAAALNVIEILKSDTDDYTTFAKLLTDTKVADEINKRQTITVLALNNAAISAIASLPSNVQKEILSLHVILDYYDPVKLDALKEKSIILTTLFQSSGQATGQMGFLNYTELPNETQVFGSAVPGAPLDSTLIGVVAARPYNISVIEVSKAIIPPGLNGAPTLTNATSPTTPPTGPATANATKPPTGSTTPSSSNATAPSSGNATTPPPKSGSAPSGSTAPAPNSNDTTPTDSKATPPSQEKSPSAGEATSPTTRDQTTPSEAPSGSDTQAPAAAAKGPVSDSSTDASSPVSTGASDGPAAGVPVSEHADSDKTSSARTIAACTSLSLVTIGLVLFGTL